MIWVFSLLLFFFFKYPNAISLHLVKFHKLHLNLKATLILHEKYENILIWAELIPPNYFLVFASVISLGVQNASLRGFVFCHCVIVGFVLHSVPWFYWAALWTSSGMRSFRGLLAFPEEVCTRAKQKKWQDELPFPFDLTSTLGISQFYKDGAWFCPLYKINTPSSLLYVASRGLGIVCWNHKSLWTASDNFLY